MPKSKTSIVLGFIETALMLLKYPKSVYWVDEDRRLACIHLLNQHNRVRARETTRMLEDYAKLKPRKHDVDGGSNRQRFIQAIRHSPYIEVLPRPNPDEKDKIYIHLLQSNEMIPGAVNGTESDIAAGPSGINQTDASVVPQMISDEHFESPLTPSLHESEEMEPCSTPLDATLVEPESPLFDFNYENMNFPLIGLENLIDSDAQPPVNSPTVGNPYSEVFCTDRLPDLTDVAALDTMDTDMANNEDMDFFPSNYDPTYDLLQSLNLTQTSYGLEVNQANGSSDSLRYDINRAWMISHSENGIDVHGPVNFNGNDRPGSAIMVSLTPH